VFRGQEEGLSTIVANPSVILSPGNWDKSSAKIFKYVWKERSFYADACVNFVDVRDVANIILKLFHSPLQNERFIINADSISFKTLLDKTAHRLLRRPPSIRLSRQALFAFARLENIRARITGVEPLVTTETARYAGTYFLYDNSKIKKALNYQFQSIDHTLDWCCTYYRKRFSKITGRA
jgi:nucleoside-diphosphate-sugar epimerase